MKTILLSITCADGEYGFDARVPDDLCAKILEASRAGSRVMIDGVLDSRCPEWAAGTPLEPIILFFSRLWNS